MGTIPNDNRITRCTIEDEIVDEHYIVAGDAIGTCKDAHVATHLGCLTFCILVLKNGFTVTGESACADPANFDVEIGQRVAREKAIEKIWPLLGYQLREKLHRKDEWAQASLRRQGDWAAAEKWEPPFSKG